MIDWGLAERVGAFVAGDPGGGVALAGDLDAFTADAITRVTAYTGLVPQRDVPPPEAVGRGRWLELNLVSMRSVLEPLTAKLELVAIESADPRWIAPAIEGLQEHVHRIRAFGSIAISLCQLATTRVDGMLTLWKARSVDCAAAQLIVRESGGHVVFPGCGDALGCKLDLDPHSPLLAARTERGVADLAAVLGSGR